MSAVGFRGVAKVFADGTRAVSGIDLEIGDGEFVVLVGPSGCGKTTLLRMLAGLESPSEGEIVIGDRRVNELAPQRRNVAMVFQNYALYPHMTVRRNLEFPLRMAGIGRAGIRERVERTAQLLALGDLLDRKPGQLSGGQRQRVAMGRAIVREPAVFLMDEPLSNLDARLRVRIRSEIAALQRRIGTTTLYVTHDQLEAMTLGDRVAVINRGRLQQVADPLTLYRRPANIFVAGFIGNPGMNIFAAELTTGDEGGAALHWGGRLFSLPGGRGADALAAHRGRRIFIGLRPESMRVGSSGSGLGAVVSGIEALGHETLVYCAGRVSAIDTDTFSDSGDCGSRPCVARLPGAAAVGVGDRVELGFEAGQLMLFGEDGNRFWPPDA